ncbi:hypothetical protein [Mucilaginibacter hurinus]|uniref:hypothetical protein n=1 Tax=Mucilaginibacter hurinus TaxID=2201324 RepID=UPI0011BE8FB6|nr:hypothetical protein [Mucilaginibacter hurinus]
MKKLAGLIGFLLVFVGVNLIFDSVFSNRPFNQSLKDGFIIGSITTAIMMILENRKYILSKISPLTKRG